jgi:hypothetical protein
MNGHPNEHGNTAAKDKISGSRGGEYEDGCLLGCCAVTPSSRLIALMMERQAPMKRR